MQYHLMPSWSKSIKSVYGVSINKSTEVQKGLLSCNTLPEKNFIKFTIGATGSELIFLQREEHFTNCNQLYAQLDRIKYIHTSRLSLYNVEKHINSIVESHPHFLGPHCMRLKNSIDSTLFHMLMSQVWHLIPA